jgi:hypothetical protein
MLEVRRHQHAEIRGDQELLELLEQRVVDRTLAREHLVEPPAEKLLRALEAVPQALGPSGSVIPRLVIPSDQQ